MLIFLRELRKKAVVNRWKDILLSAGFVIFSLVAYTQSAADSTINQQTVSDSSVVKEIIPEADTVKPVIDFDKDQAMRFLQDRYKSYNWKNSRDPLRRAIAQLVYFASTNPFDSVKIIEGL